MELDGLSSSPAHVSSANLYGATKLSSAAKLDREVVSK